MNYQILSHLHFGNYGGMLQSFALQSIVNAIGKPAQLTTYEKRADDMSMKRFLYLMYQRIFQREKVRSMKEREIGHMRVALNFSRHVTWQLFSSPTVYGFIVGSDQVWRADYARWLRSLPFFFLDFASTVQRNRSISYAASFGSDEWEGTQDETEECRRLLKEFKAVSVREHSGVKICKDVFDVDAVQMPDPTLLLHTDDYNKIIDSDKTWLPDGKYVSVYVLDESDSKVELLQEFAKVADIRLQYLLPQSTAKNSRDHLPVAVSQWLRLIRDCEYFITDSFHGCVFAIIYNKPFVCLGNERRGNARFETLLSTFGLRDRLLVRATAIEICRILNAPIDWMKVNSIHEFERKRGINFLKENLSFS